MVLRPAGWRVIGRLVPGDVAVVTSRDGHAFAGEVQGLDVCTGEVTIKLPGS